MVDDGGIPEREGEREAAGKGRKGGRSVATMGSSVANGSSRCATCSGPASALHLPCERCWSASRFESGDDTLYLPMRFERQRGESLQKKTR